LGITVASTKLGLLITSSPLSSQMADMQFAGIGWHVTCHSVSAPADRGTCTDQGALFSGREGNRRPGVVLGSA